MKPSAIEPIARLISAAVLAATLLLSAMPLPAQEAPAAGDATPGLTLAEVEAGLAAIEADAGIDDSVKGLLRPKYEQASTALKEAADFTARTADYREAIKTAPEKVAQLRARLQALPSDEGAAGVSPPRSTGDLQHAIDTRRATLNELNADLSGTTSELARVKGRPFEISVRLPETRRELSDVRKQLASPALAKDATSATRVADRILLQARQSRLLSESEMLQQEQLSQSVREELLQAQHDLLDARVQNAGVSLGILEVLMLQRLTSEAARVGSLAGMMPDDMPEDDAAAQALAAEVQILAKEFEGVVRNLNKVKAAQDDLMSRLERLTSQYESIREELQVGVGGSGMAQVLLDIQRRYRDQRVYVKELTTRVAPLDETQLASLQARRKLRNQPDVESQFSGHPSDAVATLVTTRRNILEQLRTQYGNLTRALAALEADKKEYLDKANEVRAYAAEQLFGFGMRGAPPISIKTLTAIPDGLRWFFQGTHRVELGRALQGIIARMPVTSTVIVLAVAVLLLARRRIGAALEETGDQVRRISTDRYACTGAALLYTLLLAIPIPLLIGFTGWALGQTPGSSGWIRGIAQGLQLAALISLVLTFLAAVCRPDGLGADHFRWQAQPLARFRRMVHLFAVVYIPALLVTFSGVYEEAPDYLFSVGRISFMVAQVWTTFVFWQLLNPSNGVLATFMRAQPDSLIARWRYLWFPLVLVYPLALVVIAGLGYIYTAIQLSLGLLGTAAWIIAGTILYRLTRRWFRMKQRKLALTEALQKRRARQDAAASEAQQESGDLVTIDAEAEQALDLVTITEQTGYLLRLFFSLGVAVVILLAWSEQFPLIATLDSIPVPLAGGLTLLGLMKGVLIVVVTYIAVRNLPGLLELAVLRTTAVDAGTRHAISTLFQYAVIAIGLTLFFNVLSVDWAKLGWIAAALSVGIGFGLQEVFANFVCGLILLFERPIRVGDVVTVNNVTGTVTKIQIRATTITNGDRQAFVVPNKSLITGSLLNWTLNAAVNRITIRLGVAGGTDTDTARQILLDVAADHPLVLDDPAPMAIFEEFGASSQNLVLFAYLANLGDRSSTTTELLTEIARRFAGVGIEVAKPQLDIHIHRENGSSYGAGSAVEV